MLILPGSTKDSTAQQFEDTAQDFQKTRKEQTSRLRRYTIAPRTRRWSTSVKQEPCQNQVRSRKNEDKSSITPKDRQRSSKKTSTAVSAFVNSYKIDAIMKCSYKIAIRIGLNSSSMRPIICLFDIAAARSQLHEDMVNPDLMRSISVSE